MPASIPKILYGTAWKKSTTSDLVTKAIQAGFKGIDTACQPKHYQETLVGDAIAQFPREELFIQTKYTPIGGQDTSKPLPYDKNASITTQVTQSIETSLKNLKTSYIDSVLLHSPLPTHAQTMEAWRELESQCRKGTIMNLGISNIYDAARLERIILDAEIKPRFVQNRFYQETEYDSGIRSVCSREDIIYQTFWTLTGNPHIFASKTLQDIASRLGWTEAQTWYKFVMQLGGMPLSGTTSAQHMKEDVQVEMLPPLNDADFQSISSLIA